MNKKRDFSVDVLRSIGIMCIVLAHVSPPRWMVQIRSFDVPFMVVLSGYLFSKSTFDSERGLGYIWKRFKRLVVPVWIFLALIFAGGGNTRTISV